MTKKLRFLVDETSLDTETNAEVVTAMLERLVARVREVHDKHEVAKFSAIWDQMVGEHPLFEWIFSRDLGIDPVAAAALRAALSRMPDWDSLWDINGLPTQVSISGENVDAFSIAAATRETSHQRSTACLSASIAAGGPTHVQAGDFASEVHFIRCATDVLEFFRAVPEVDDLDEEAYFENAPFAFPDIDFVRSRTQFGGFDEDYATIRVKVTKHLAVLNDHARTILSAATPAAVKEATFGARGVNASGESALTKANHAAMKQREVVVGGETIVCDWHTKLRPHLDRIYFNATTRPRVVVGVFRDHLA